MTSIEPFNKAAPILIFSYGNPSRGDDALGPAMYELLKKDSNKNSELKHVDLLIDYQLQIEHAVDLEQRHAVIFVDASASCPLPYEFRQLHAERDSSYTSHAMSPSAILAVYQQINQQPPPASFMLSIRGYEFGLGQTISQQANLNLQKAYVFIKKTLATDISQWVEVPKGKHNKRATIL